TVSLVAGSNVVTLDWDVPAGDFYRLQVSGAANLYYSTSGVAYPYNVPGILQIHNSSGGHSQYYYCYDWKVKSPDIIQTSSRTPATVSIGTNGPTLSCVSSNTITCSLPTATLTAQATPSSGNTITGYSWSNGATTQSIPVNNGTSYTVTVTQSNGCSVSSSCNAVIDTCRPTVVASNNGPITCTSPTRTISATITPCGSQLVNSIWSNGTSTNSFSTSVPGNYTVTVTQSNGCSSAASTTLTSNTTPPTVNCTAGQNITCTNTSTILSSNAIASSGNSIASYSWSPGGQGSAAISVSNGNSYTVVVTQSNGCTASSFCAATVDTCRPSVSATNNGPLTCTNPTRTVSASATACTGKTIASYGWTNGSNTASFTTGNPGTYTVTITQSGNNCTASSTTTLTSAITTPIVSFTGLASSYADNAPPATLTGSPSGGIFSGPGITGNQFSPSLAGVGGPYSIVYSFTDVNGCSGSQTQTTAVFASQQFNCGVPTNLTATNITGTTAIIGWSYATAPSFRLRFRRVGSTTYSYKTFSPAAGVFTYQLTGLRKNTSYEVSLQTTCTSGASAFSLPVTFRTTSANIRLANGTNGNWSEDQNCLLYPNPASEILYFTCENVEESSSVTWEVYDIVGKLMINGKDNLGQIDVSGLSKGTYLLKLYANDTAESIRFIKD
ncbi:MAG: T9SS type A sorting domain-containing protein, partial [Bacteroidota bacterium]